MACIRTAVSYCTAFVVVAALLYRPVPSDIGNPWMYLMGMNAINAGSYLTSLYAILGGNPAVIDQYLVGYLFGNQGLSPTVQVKHNVFDTVPVQIYSPIEKDDTGGAARRGKKKLRPALVYMHGGGFRVGKPDCCTAMYSDLVDRLGLIIISVQYRLAPQHLVPTAFDDSLTAAIYIFTHAQTLGIDADNIGISGESAGGNMAAALCLRLRDRKVKGQQFRYQVLIYPWLQAVDFSLPSLVDNDKYTYSYMTREGLATHALVYAGLDLSYIPALLANNHTSLKTKQLLVNKQLDRRPLARHIGEDKSVIAQMTLREGDLKLSTRLQRYLTDPYNWPLMADDVANLPPALVYSLKYDTIRDEAIMYAERMRAMGSHVTLVVSKLGWHGMIAFAKPSWFVGNQEMNDHIVKFVKNVPTQGSVNFVF